MDFSAQMTANLLLKGTEKEGSNRNLVLSPLSFNAILNMTAAGSKGRTFGQFRKFLKCNNVDDLNRKFEELMSIATSSTDDHHDETNDNDDGPILCVANGLWVDYRCPLKPSYLELVKNVYKAHAKNVDFLKEAKKVVDEANAWAKSSTKGLVTNVLKYGDIKPDSTKLIIGNALYFKGTWSDKFNSESTMDKDFYLLNGDKISAPFMTGCYEYSHQAYDSFELVKIPYKKGMDGNMFSMFIFLPTERDGLPKLLHKASTDPGFFRQNFKLENWTYNVFWIPKFKFTYVTAQAPQIMSSMGLDLPFKIDCKELTEMVQTSGDPFYVSTIIQKAVVEVDEGGTEAAAVTYESDEDMGFSLYYEPPKIYKFVADHPFLFMIREEKAKAVLFTGVVLNPLLQE